MRTYTLVASAILAGLCAPATAAFAPGPAGRRALVRQAPLKSPLRPHRALVAPSSRSATIALSAARTASPSFGAYVARAAAWCLASMLALVLASTRVAFAASRRSSGGGVANVAKYGFVGACMAAGWAFRQEETPVIRETPGAAVVDTETLKAPPPPEAPAARVSQSAPLQEEVAEVEPLPQMVTDDSALFGSLQARMQSLADEQAAGVSDEVAAPADDSYAPPVDSADGWGTGDTAVLEPPRPGEEEPKAADRGVLDGDAPLEFPPGFPLVDGDVVEPAEPVDVTPAASADQIAMFNRMMGNGGD